MKLEIKLDTDSDVKNRNNKNGSDNRINTAITIVGIIVTIVSIGFMVADIIGVC